MRVDPNYVTNLTSAIDSSSLAEQQLTTQLASGLRFSSLSGDPVAASQNVSLSSTLAGIDSFVVSASGTEGRLQVADSVLGEVVSQVTSAISLATGAGDGTLSAANLATVAQQVSQLRDGIVSLANTAYQGQYLFSGSQGGTKPFSVDGSTSPATATYAGDMKTQTTVTSEGQTLQTSLAGSSVFTASGADLLGTLNRLASDLAGGNTANVAAETSQLSAALGNLSSQRSILGSSLSRLNSASSYASTEATVIESQQSNLLSADTAAVATNLKTAETQHQAILSTVAALTQTNLFAVLFR